MNSIWMVFPQLMNAPQRKVIKKFLVFSSYRNNSILIINSIQIEENFRPTSKRRIVLKVAITKVAEAAIIRPTPNAKCVNKLISKQFVSQPHTLLMI